MYHNVILDDQTLSSFSIHNILPVHVVNEKDSDNVLTSHYDLSNPVPSSGASQQSRSEVETIFDSIVVSGVNTNTTINQMHAAAILHMKENYGGFLQIPHGNMPINKFCNPSLLPLTYPTLFPYGLGRFENLQCSTALSFKQQVKYFFSLAAS